MQDPMITIMNLISTDLSSTPGGTVIAGAYNSKITLPQINILEPKYENPDSNLIGAMYYYKGVVRVNIFADNEPDRYLLIEEIEKIVSENWDSVGNGLDWISLDGRDPTTDFKIKPTIYGYVVKISVFFRRSVTVTP